VFEELIRSDDEVPNPEDHPVSRLVRRTLSEAIERGASDVHVVPGPAGGEIRHRIDGFFETRESLSPAETARAVARLKVLAGLAAFRTGEPQDGRIELEHEGARVELRLSTIPVLGGEKAVVRLFGAARRLRLDEAGFSPGALEALRDLLSRPPGVIFVVGPCSSGKTTTLYAIARELLASSGAFTNVVSAEDPVEQRVDGMAQSQVDLPRGVDFPALLRALLRQDPEVLFVTETRDAETARIVVEAGFTGHRVFTSIHAAEPSEILRRLEALGVSPPLAREAIRGAISQRLLRRTCRSCRGEGCDGCGGRGYAGRLAVAEVALFERGEARLTTPSLAEDAARRVETGESSRAEVERVLGRGVLP
jgi:type II secretory ATPase GspE/PulE/Tfp pilus assembly ATPase PilB-like protein